MKPTEPVGSEAWRASENLFITFENGKFVLWDYLKQRRFAVDATTLECIREWSKVSKKELTDLDVDLFIKELIGPPGTKENQIQLWEWDIISYIFHVGTQYKLEDKDLLEPEEFTDDLINTLKNLDTKKLDLYSKKEGEIISLPEANTEILNENCFWDVLLKRKTCREYFGKNIEKETLATLLHSTFGRSQKSYNDSTTTWSEIDQSIEHIGYRRTSASGGSLQVIEAYVVVSHVSDVPAGLYHYDSLNHNLVLIRKEVQKETLRKLLAGQYFGDGAAVGVFLTARLDRAWWRYKVSRGYRVALLDTGHISQTFQLIATALGLNTWVSAAFLDVAVEDFLKLETPTEAPFMYVCAGHGSGSAFNKLHAARIDKQGS